MVKQIIKRVILERLEKKEKDKNNSCLEMDFRSTINFNIYHLAFRYSPSFL